jgi:two-component system, chemotaxis family, protein-glutamate methylesterase/glutaminase
VIKILPIDAPGFLQIVIRKILLDDKCVRLFPSMKCSEFSIETIKTLQPDVVIIAMDAADVGVLEIIKAIMRLTPRPIVLYSESEGEHERRILNSLEHGAVDYFSLSTCQSSINISKSHELFLDIIRYWGERGLPPFYQQPIENPPLVVANNGEQVAVEQNSNHYDLVVIGVSTGGVVVLLNLLDSIEDISSPIVVALQVEDCMRQPLIEQLSQKSGRVVAEGQTGMVLQKNSTTFISASGDGAVKKNISGEFVFNTIYQSGLTDHPSINQLFISAASQADSPVGVILSGHSEDGVDGVLAFSRRGFPVLVQDPESSLVSTMPNATIKSAAEIQILSSNEIGRYLQRNKPQ